MIRHAISNLNAWLAILAVVISSSSGDVLLSRAMKQIGDLGALRAKEASHSLCSSCCATATSFSV
jgi:hypothetical protein